MSEENKVQVQSDSAAHLNDARFVEYYSHESASERAVERALGIMGAVQRARHAAQLPQERLAVADIGCNAGTQSRCWLERDHSVQGLDISRDLVGLARQRNAEFKERCSFHVGSATALPWSNDTFDVCLLPELLEHVEDWESVVREAARVLKPGGTLYLSTTNVLCPIQQEFSLPGYSWYPAPIKRWFLQRARTTHRQLVNFATYPAVHWFSPYGLSHFLRGLGIRSLDRFDLIDLDSKGAAAKLAVASIKVLPPLRFAAHVLTPSTVLVGIKQQQTR